MGDTHMRFRNVTPRILKGVNRVGVRAVTFFALPGECLWLHVGDAIVVRFREKSV